PAGVHLLLRVRRRVGRLNGVEQDDALHLGAWLARGRALGELESDLVGQGPAEAPAAEHDRATVGQGDDLVQVGRSALLQAALEAFDAVDRDVLRQAAGQRLVDHRGATGWVEEEHARLFGAGRAG